MLVGSTVSASYRNASMKVLEPHQPVEKSMSWLKKYLSSTPADRQTSAAIAYLASLDAVRESYPPIAESIVQELRDQRATLKLIASENYCSLPVQLAMGNLLTDKYSEGYVRHRFYAGCGNVDAIEENAGDLAKQIFGSDHAYVQPHSGADANLIAFWSILVQKVQTREVEALGKKSVDELTPHDYEKVRQLLVNQKIMGMSLGAGGHLTHGYRHNISAKMMKAVSYDVSPETGLLDYAVIEKRVKEEKPLILIAGYSAYSRLVDFAKMREIADTVGAVFLVDMAHFSGLVAGKVFEGNFNPTPFAHIVTSTTHKTLRGPRGGMILCAKEFAEAVNKGCPLVQGGPLPHVMAAKAVAFKEALSPEFRTYARQIVTNAKALAEGLMKRGVRVLTDGTDNHLVVIDVASSFHLTGRQAETLMHEAGLTASRNMIPSDPNGPWYTSGVRVGTAAVTTRGLREKEMDEIASILSELLKSAKPILDEKTGGPSRAKAKVSEEIMLRSKSRVKEILSRFPLYPELGVV